MTFTLVLGLGISSISAQQTDSIKNFSSFKGIVTGIDFFAASRQTITPFEKPISEARQRMVDLLGSDLPKGAIFICSTLKQKDSFYEPRALRMGYAWVLLAQTPEIRGEEMLARLKSQMGGQVSPEVLARIKSRSSTVESGQIRTLQQQMAFAILQETFAPDREFRSSRVEDVVRSPLPDWLDVGIATYAVGSNVNLGFLQQHLEEAFRLEDVLTMSRPFVAPTTGGGAGGGQTAGLGGAATEGASPVSPTPGGGAREDDQQRQGGGGRRGGGSRVLPKDQQDRLLFDGQAATFFAYLSEKVGVAKIKQLIEFSREGKESPAFLTQPDILGSDFSKIEDDWVAWVKAREAAAPPDRSRNPSR